MTSTTRLAEDETHVWAFDVDRAHSRLGTERLLAVLSDTEKARQRRFVFARDRHTFAVSHCLLRLVLSRYAAVTPESWAFDCNRWGRPEIGCPPVPDLRFNMSHANGAVAVAVARQPQLGVDIEPWNRPVVVPEASGLGYALTEVEDLQGKASDERPHHFLRLWTLKEAYAKARGLGLSLDFSHVSFTLGAHAPSACFDPALEDEPSAWHFSLWSPLPGYCLALAVRHPGIVVRFHSLDDLLDVD